MKLQLDRIYNKEGFKKTKKTYVRARERGTERQDVKKDDMGTKSGTNGRLW